MTLPSETLALLEAAKCRFVDADPSWAREKWVRPEQLHVTLKFAGPLPDERIGEVCEALATTCAAHPPFDLALAEVRAKPSPAKARMLWTTLEGDLRSCSHLARSISRELGARFGVPEPDRPFAAHVTLARARDARPVAAAALSAAEAGIEAGKDSERIVSVRYVTLFASTLGPAGPVHEALGHFPLG